MSGGMITADVSGKADTVLSTKGDIATWDTQRVRKGVSATNYTGLQADSAIADGLVYGATARSTMTGIADMIYSSAANTLSRLAVGSARQVLQTNTATNALEWSNSPQSLMGTTGDILAASSANTLSVITPSTSGHVLTSTGAASLPTFQAASGGGGKMELVGSTVLTSAEEEIELVISPAINMSDISYLRVICNVKADSLAAEGQNNEMRVNSISSSTYNWDGARVQGGTEIIENASGDDKWTVLQNNHNGNRFGIIDLICNRASETIEAICHSGGQDGGMWIFCYNSEAGQTTFSNITLYSSLIAGVEMAIGSRIDVYKCVL